MNEIRVEMVVPAMVPAGMEMVVARLAQQLIARGYSVGISCIEHLGSLGERLRDEGMAVEVARCPGLRTLLFPDALTQYLRTRRPDIVHVHSGAWLKGARAASLAGVQTVVHTEHGLLDYEPRYAPMLKRFAARYTTAIAAVSAPLLTYLREVDGLPPAKLHLVPNGVDTTVFTPEGPPGDLRRRFGLSAERIVIGHVARFDPVKNHPLLLEAFARLHARRPETFLALVGDGGLRPTIERRIDELGLREHVGLYGIADTTPPIYREFDIFVLSSIAEGTSMSILEAMATGLPVVATRVGGNADLIDDTGLLVPPQDAAAFSDALERLVCPREERRAFGAAARRRVLHEYAESRVVDRYEALYRGEAMHTASIPAMNENACAE